MTRSIGQRFRRFLVVAALPWMLMVAPRSAMALSDAERAGARAAAQAGEEAFKAQKWAEAVDYYQRAEAVVHSPVHLLFIGRAEASQGHLVEAREALLKVQRDTLTDASPAAFRQAHEEAGAELSKIDPRIAYVTVTVSGAASADVTVTSDGKPIPSSLLGVPIPMNPGAHQLQASLGDRRSETITVTLAEGGRQAAALTLPAAGAGAPSTPGGPADPGAATVDVGTGSSPAAGGGPNVLRLVSYGALGVGVIGLGVGTVFALQSNSKRDDADAAFGKCGAGGCTPAEEDKINGLDADSDSAKTLATVGFVAGGVGIAAGVTLFFLSAEKSGGTANAPGIRPWVGLASAGVSGSF